jgi:cysteine synthase A
MHDQIRGACESGRLCPGDAILMAQALCSTLGLAVGISSGANVLGAMHLVEALGDDATVVTVLPDSNKKYRSTDLGHEQPVLEHYLTPRVRLESFTAVRAARRT